MVTDVTPLIPRMANKTAILGWGSLMCDSRPEFDQHVTGWQAGGPRLPLEFSRKSKSRKDALTLVIDSVLGTECETLYTLSRRSDPQDAICDLRCREGTTMQNIGYVNVVTGENRPRNADTVEVIRTWAQANDIQLVTWTDLSATFSQPKSDEFCVAALSHLKSLDLAGIRAAVEYILKAPRQVTTALRTFLQNDAWFKEQATLCGYPA